MGRGCELLKHHLRAEGAIQRARAEAGDGVQRPGDELPERFELLERRAAGVIVVRSWRLSVLGVAANRPLKNVSEAGNTRRNDQRE